MAMNIVDDRLVISIPNSEAINRCQLIGIKDSEVGSFYTNDNEELRNNIIKFLGNFFEDFYLSVIDIKEYLKLIKKNVTPYSHFFKNNLLDLQSTIDYFNNIEEEYLLIPKMFMNGRYLKFVNDNEIVKKFRMILFGEITNLEIAKKEFGYILVPKLRRDFENLIMKYVRKHTKGELLEAGTSKEKQKAENIVYYGSPGCGKSYFVNQLYCYDDELYERTIFHPEYSYYDFVGQIVPTLSKNNLGDDVITYQFNPGPFTRILCKALMDVDSHYYLIIEELNRGNAPAIFGDIFQLLDRDAAGKSVYKINNFEISNYLSIQGVSFSKDEKIFLPNNLSIICTMNTSDQNVFTLDTAFKRRWNMYKMSNEFTTEHPYASYYIPGTKKTWREFVDMINNRILDDSYLINNAEDKQLGVFFVSENELVKHPNVNNEEALKLFVDKVFFYLWEDVARFNRLEWFNSDIKTLDQLVQLFISSDDKFNAVFNHDWYDNDNKR